MKILITGGPGDGFVFYGPFDSHADAAAWAEWHMDGPWWIATLFPAPFESREEVGKAED
jgi:hypothetical protein